MASIPLSALDSVPDPTWAWAPYTPDAARPWNLARAGHLLRRAAYGASWSDLQQALADGPERTVDRLLHPAADVETFNRDHDQIQDTGGDSWEGLRSWWLRRMLDTPQPLQETMTLFWLDSFALPMARVNEPRLVKLYLRRLRRHALGSFETLLQEMAADPAVLLSLHAGANRKARPNLELPQAFLERFTVGPGVCSKTDLDEAARAFTGRFVLRGQYRFIEREHDAGRKSLLNQEGDFGAPEVIRIAVRHPATLKRLAARLYRWFVSETQPLPDSLVEAWLGQWTPSEPVAMLVERLLRSNLFCSADALQCRIKGPVEFALSLIKALEGIVGTTRLGDDLARLGQDLLQPPCLTGWAGHQYWINRYTMAARCQLAASLLDRSGPYGDGLNPEKVARRHGISPTQDAIPFLLDLLLPGLLNQQDRSALIQSLTELAAPDPDRSGEPLRRVTAAIATLPGFQVT